MDKHNKNYDEDALKQEQYEEQQRDAANWRITESSIKEEMENQQRTHALDDVRLADAQTREEQYIAKNRSTTLSRNCL